MSETNTYIPGVCNIGKEEIKKRRNGAIFAAIFAIVLAVYLESTHANKLWRLFIFFPLTSAAVGFQQWFFKFCVGFGMKGLFNFNDLGRMESVEQLEMRKADRSKAIKMIVTGIVIALGLTVVFYLFN